ncbi:hypothetical protein [Niabella ginsengisoli]|uniref:Uncharacterized protein n=1 Tax=Niabella ginsengisoli TaxID=522298 RepID=A0ABS9SGT4_9BACT|nr:hypothetical protein [Niabella ginsengisoli]MCH5597581.1 hypothetical protein [Niabella ginsengisoli]
MTVETLITTYNNYTNEQLLEVHAKLNDYSFEAKQALTTIIKNRGGLDVLLNEDIERKEAQKEIARIKDEVRQSKNVNFDEDFLVKAISSNRLDKNQVRQIIQDTRIEIHQDLDDRKIKPRTIVAGIPAAILASLLSGVMWGLQIMWSGRMFLIFFIGVILICYGMIKGLTKQSYKNLAVIILTILSIICALLIGQLMYELFGRQ